MKAIGGSQRGQEDYLSQEQFFKTHVKHWVLFRMTTFGAGELQ